MEIASKGLFAAFYARDEITGFYLAQEGIEYIRNARDTLYLLSTTDEEDIGNWLQGLDECVVADPEVDHGCIIETTSSFYSSSDFDDDAISECDSGGCDPLQFDDDTLYTYDPGDDSKFTRTIKMTVDPLDQEALIESTVTWNAGALFASTKSFTLKERIFNWQQNQ
jgi:hypothetical protein